MSKKHPKESGVRDEVQKVMEGKKSTAFGDAAPVPQTSKVALEELQTTVEDLKLVVQDQEALIKSLLAPPLEIGTVHQVFEKTAVVFTNGKTIEVSLKQGLEVVVGTQVRINKAGAIVDAIQTEALGSIVVFRRMVDNRVAEVEDSSGGIVTVVSAIKADKNDRLIVNAGVVIKNLGKQEERFTLSEQSKICWDDIGGQELAKQALREAIELPLEHPAIFKHYGKKAANGVLLFGPPGCGKTLLAKAVANSIARHHGVDKGGSLMYVKGPELLSKWVGESESSIRSLFSRAREFKKANGFPAVLFIDEAESILSKRGSGISSDVNTTNVPAFLTEMDGMEESSCIVILATNRADRLDPAIIREGRIDRKIKINRPGQEETQKIFGIHLKGRPVQGSVQELCQASAKEIFNAERVLRRIKTKKGEQLEFTLSHLVSGAMVAGVVEGAISCALNRDIKSGKPSSITVEDVKMSVERTFRDLESVNHEDAIEDIVPSEQIASIDRVK